MPAGVPEEEEPEAWPLYFFLSYARADGGDGPYLERFHQDLRAEVRLRVGASDASTVGFFDRRSIEPGQDWSAELGAALARCRTFVAMCSPTFFASVYCGREWTVFDGRLRAAAAGGQGSPAVLLPVIWTPLRDPPKVFLRLQYDHQELGTTYAQRGLRYLLQLDRNHDMYQEFLVALATRIVRLAHESPLPPHPEAIDFDQVPNMFQVRALAGDGGAPSGASKEIGPSGSPGSAEPQQPPADPEPKRELTPDPHQEPHRHRHRQPQSRPETQGGGPSRVTFVLASTSRDEIAVLREHLDFYGSDFDEWTPYRPLHDDRVCVLAQMVAARQGMTSAVTRLDDGVADLLERSTARNEIVILLVDMWAAKLDEIRLALTKYDRRNEPTSGVLVPFNPDDLETHENLQHLKETLASALRNNVMRRDRLFREEIRSREEFDRALIQIIVDSQARIFEHRRIFRAPKTARGLPRLAGP
ncbi:TIR domain-containing protein [Frankia sp. CcI49]|nr:TIR domain-containing protein [Frankia sp. CcI49]